jgi:hypothetical protein
MGGWCRRDWTSPEVDHLPLTTLKLNEYPTPRMINASSAVRMRAGIGFGTSAVLVTEWFRQYLKP